MLGVPVHFSDLEAYDNEYYNSLKWVVNNNITGTIDQNFTVETEEFGVKKIIELKPGGKQIQVTEENKMEYIQLVTEMRLTTAIKAQINAFLEGFHTIISKTLISLFNERELELLISGLPEIDINDLYLNTEYHGGYTKDSPVVQWFWQAVRSFNQEEKARLIQFVTGTSRVPLEGFKAIRGIGGPQKFQIHKTYGEDRLPSAHTCFNQIDLPEYSSYEKLREKLILAIKETQGFAFG